MEQINMFDLVNQPPNRTKLSIVISFHLWICICASSIRTSSNILQFHMVEAPPTAMESSMTAAIYFRFDMLARVYMFA